MKKFCLTILLFTICLSFMACGDKEIEEHPIDRNIDAVAAYLGYTDGEEIIDVDDQVNGAKVGKDFDNRNISIYEFDPLSYEYKDEKNQLAICNGGFVLMISGNEITGDEESDLIEKFESIKFKED